MYRALPVLITLLVGCPTQEEPLDLDPPPEAGPFLSISAGYRRTCGLTLDGYPQCWSNAAGLMQDVPAEPMSQVTAGMCASCGVRNDRTVVCWGTCATDLGEPLPGEFVRIAQGYDSMCGVRQGDVLECWKESCDGACGGPYGEPHIAAVRLGATEHGCGLRPDGSAVGWGYGATYGLSDIPGATFVTVTAGKDHGCGVEEDGTGRCWGEGSGQPAASLRYVGIDTRDEMTCGLTTDGIIDCFDSPPEYLDTEGPFTQIAVGTAHVCGLTAEGEARCFGGYPAIQVAE